MKRLLLIVPSGKIGGIEIASYNLYKLFIENDFEIKVVKCIKDNDDLLEVNNEEFLARRYIGKNILIKIKNLICSLIKLKTIKHKFKPDITISNGDYCNTINGLVFSDEIQIGIIHSVKSEELKTQGLFGKICLFGIKYLYKNFEKIICISEGIRKDIIDNFKTISSEKLEVIYNYHDFEKIKKLSKENLDSDQEEELFKDDIILSLGRIVDTKAPWHLIKSFSLLVKENPKLKLVFIGPVEKTLAKNLEKLVEILNIKDKVYFLGGKSNPYKYLKRAKISAMTSYFEGLPNVIVEALTLKIPVISTDSSLGIWEVIGEQKFKSVNFDKKGVAFFENGIIVKKFEEETFILSEENIKITEQEKRFSEYTQILLKDYLPEEIDTEKTLRKFSFKEIEKEYLNLFDQFKTERG